MDFKSSSHLAKHTNGKSGVDVGIVYPSYGYERVSYSLPVKSVNFKKVYTLPIHRFFKSNFYKNTPIILSPSDLLHTWNTIPIGRSPFIISFENEIPRYFGRVFKWQERLGLSVLNSNRCRGVLALSQVAADQAKAKMKLLGYPKIASKIKVFRGGVSLGNAFPLEARRSYVNDDYLNIIFVGADVFPKGFVPAFYALESLVQAGFKIRLTVIGRFKASGYVLKEYSPEPNAWRKRLGEAGWVTHYEQLPNNKVLEQISLSDLLISPSYDETLGWAVIEAGLLRVPSITTNVFAFTELVKHDLSGYVINLKLGEQGRWQGVWESGVQLKRELQEADKTISVGIREAVLKIIKNPSLVSAWGRESKEHMDALYDPKKAAQALSEIYNNALASCDH